MDTLNEIVSRYLDANGISSKYFAECIGCGYSYCLKWLKGGRKLRPEQIKKTYDFLNGKYYKSVDDIMKGE